MQINLTDPSHYNNIVKIHIYIKDIVYHCGGFFFFFTLMSVLYNDIQKGQ